MVNFVFALKDIRCKTKMYIGTYIREADDSTECVRICIPGLWGCLYVKEEGFTDITKFVINICDNSLTAELKCELSSAPGDDYYVQFENKTFKVINARNQVLIKGNFYTFRKVTNDLNLWEEK